MTPYEKYKQAIAARPSNEDIKYWASLDTKATEAQKKVFDAEVKIRSEAFTQWLADYDAKKVMKSNGRSLEEWANDFREHVGLMSGLDRDAIPMSYIEEHYNLNEQSSIAALDYVNFYEPNEPDPEREAAKAQMNIWMDEMALADRKQKERLKNALVAKVVYERVDVSDK